METAGKAYAWDRLLFRWLVVLLLGGLTLSRAKVPVFHSDAYALYLYPDLPFVLCFLVLFVCAAIGLRKGVPLRNFWSFITFPVFLLWLLISGLMKSVNPAFFISTFALWVLAYLAFLLIPPILRRYELENFCVDAFLGWTLFAGIIHLGAAMVVPHALTEGAKTVFAGNRAHPGLFFLLSLCVALAAWSQRSRRLHVAAITISILGILVSGSRASLIGAAGILLLAVIFGRSKKLALWGLPSIALLGLLTRIVIHERSGDSFAVTAGTSIDASTGMRFIIWIKCWEIINQSADHFFFGIGYGNFRFLFNRLVNAPLYANAAHNLYLHYWTETGLVGLILMLLVPLNFFFFFWRRGRTTPSLRYFAYLILAILFTGLTQETLLPDPFLGNFITLLFLMLGVFAYQAKASDQKPPVRGSP